MEGPESIDIGDIAPVKYCSVVDVASATEASGANQTSYKVEFDEDGIANEQEYIPVETYPPVIDVLLTFDALTRVNAEPEGPVLVEEPENTLTQSSPSPIPGRFTNLPLIML